MMRKIVILAALLLLAACSSGGGSGGGGMTCTKSGDLTGSRAACAGSLDSLSGNKSLAFDMSHVAVEGSVNVKITVSVKSGAVKVSFRNREGRTISGDASANQPLTLEDRVFVDASGKARIDLDSAHGISMGVMYAAQFTG
jgi:hypothetical protein